MEIKKVLHEGQCGSLRLSDGAAGCQCPDKSCVLHGHCCDCIAFHKSVWLSMPDSKVNIRNLDWLPKCYFPLLKKQFGYETTDNNDW